VDITHGHITPRVTRLSVVGSSSGANILKLMFSFAAQNCLVRISNRFGAGSDNIGRRRFLALRVSPFA
jgi:hypothetical protein